MNKLNQLNSQLAAAEKEFNNIRTAIHKQKVSLIKGRTIRCDYCEKGSRLETWGFVQDFKHTPPYGCSGGACWDKSETRVCYLLCPKCSAMNYIYNHAQREEIVDLVEKQGVKKEEVFSAVFEKYSDAEPKQVHPKL
ncbi:MAG: hypothetical protein ACYCZ7_02130 [Minisyncoccota bacterium]